MSDHDAEHLQSLVDRCKTLEETIASKNRLLPSLIAEGVAIERARAEKAEAEAEREKARADTAEKEAEGLMLHVERAEKEIKRLRAELAGVAMAAGMASKQSHDVEPTQQGPSDEKKDEEMDRIDHLVYCADPSKMLQWIDRGCYESEADYVKRKTFEALQAMAKRLRRAGVKL